MRNPELASLFQSMVELKTAVLAYNRPPYKSSEDFTLGDRVVFQAEQVLAAYSKALKQDKIKQSRLNYKQHQQGNSRKY